MNNLPNTPNLTTDDDENLVQRIDALSVSSDAFDFIEAIKALATATADERAAVVAWCNEELDAMNAQIDVA